MSHAKGEDASREAAGIAAFLRALAKRAERDSGLAAVLMASLEESGLLPAASSQRVETGKRSPRQSRAGAESEATQPPVMEPFALWRTQGEDALRAALNGLDLAALRAVVRTHRLDPARVSSRWTARDRVIALIMTQVKARLNHGRAFERV